jgi:hypothetical protein
MKTELQLVEPTRNTVAARPRLIHRKARGLVDRHGFPVDEKHPLSDDLVRNGVVDCSLPAARAFLI